MADLLAAPRHAEIAERGIDLGRGDTEPERQRGSVEGVGHGLCPHDRELGVKGGAVRERDGETRATVLVDDHVGGADGIRGVKADELNIDASGVGKRLADERREIVLTVKDERGAGSRSVLGRLHAAQDLGLGASDVLAAAEDADVRCSDLGDDGERGLGALREALDLVQMVHPHLENEHLGVGRCRENRHGQADEVVVVRLGRIDAVTGGEERAEHVLGRRLADGAGDTDHARGERGAVVVRKAEQKLGGVIGDEDRGVGGVGCLDQLLRGLARHDDRSRTRFDRLRGEIVAVHALAGKRDEDRIPLDLARVDDATMTVTRLGTADKPRSRRLA